MLQCSNLVPPQRKLNFYFKKGGNAQVACFVAYLGINSTATHMVKTTDFFLGGGGEGHNRV